MLVFIPMAGFGDRYLRAGYDKPKPLIDIDGQPMIARVLEAFPSDVKLLFGVNRRHAEETPILAELKKLRPNARVVVLEPHKDGPIQTLLSCEKEIPLDEDVLLNYCDFGVRWDFQKFSAWLEKNKWDGAMTAYRGFHPHSLGPTLYAYMRSDGDRVIEIREKHHFTKNKFEEFASSGLYYFRRGADMLRIAREMIASGERVNGEFYVSMAIERLIEQGGRVGVYELDKFFQWGTPEDLRDYETWSAAMRKLDAFTSEVKKAPSRSLQVIPMAGRGQRFVDQGYADPKPLITVAGRTMIEQSIAALPQPKTRTLVVQAAHADDARFRKMVASFSAPTNIIRLDHVTEGQACTAKLGMERLDLDAPVLFAPCDCGYVYDVAKWQAIEQAAASDIVLFTAKNHLPAIWRPQMYGWVDADASGNIRTIAVKKAVADVPLADQQVVTGTFWFKSGKIFMREVDAMIAANDRVNGEFYIDTIARRMVEHGEKTRAFTVEKYIPWGTPEELKTFDYWNDVFRGGRDLGT
jgi:NDP-sugar pyrophosphorylase family protein